MRREPDIPKLRIVDSYIPPLTKEHQRSQDRRVQDTVITFNSEALNALCDMALRFLERGVAGPMRSAEDRYCYDEENACPYYLGSGHKDDLILTPKLYAIRLWRMRHAK